MQIEMPEIVNVDLGGKMTIPWHIANNNNHSTDQISIFVRSEAMGFETEELLIGKLSSGETKSGEFSIDVPTYMELGPLALRVGVAVGAWPIAGAINEIAVNIEKRALADVHATIALVDEVGGKLNGVLEPGEKANVEIEIVNDGEHEARQLAVKLENISGSQVRLRHSKSSISGLLIAPGESKKILVPIVGGSKMYSSEIGLGLFVDSMDLKIPFASRVAVRGLPNRPLEKVSNLIGH